MSRPRRPRQLFFEPQTYYFKPQGIPLRLLDEVVLSSSELEALKLHDVDGLDHMQAAAKMGISQPTFGRDLDRAYKKIAQAIISGKAIKIEYQKDE
ncbi:DUF134 domain-containing protein [Candidatus Beckwithbacteria bacterium]|nr:DUF134 domain-containing protein [Candidatus Beckwithbacteria bacterium]